MPGRKPARAPRALIQSAQGAPPYSGRAAPGPWSVGRAPCWPDLAPRALIRARNRAAWTVLSIARALFFVTHWFYWSHYFR